MKKPFANLKLNIGEFSSVVVIQLDSKLALIQPSSDLVIREPRVLFYLLDPRVTYRQGLQV